MGSIKHRKTSTIPNALNDTQRIGGDDWNNDHDIDLGVEDIEGLEARLIPVDQVVEYRDDALQYRNEAGTFRNEAEGFANEAEDTLDSTLKKAEALADDGTDRVRGTWFGGTIALLSSLATSTGASLIGFIQNLTGAITRSISSKLSDTVSGKDFGGVWDGVADVSAVIQLALNSGAKRVDLLHLPAKVSTAIQVPAGVALVNANLIAGTAGMKTVLLNTGCTLTGKIAGTGYSAGNEWGIYPAVDGVTDVALDIAISNLSVAAQIMAPTGGTMPSRWKGTIRASGLTGGGAQSNGYALLLVGNDCELTVYSNNTPRHCVYVSAGASGNKITAFSKNCGGAPIQIASFDGSPYCENNEIIAFISDAAPIVGNTADPYALNIVGLARENKVRLKVRSSPLTQGGVLFRANGTAVFPYRNEVQLNHTGGYAGPGVVRSDSGVENIVRVTGEGVASAGAGTALISVGVYSGWTPVGVYDCALRIAGLAWDAQGANMRGVASLAAYAPVDIGPGHMRGFKNSIGALVYKSGGGEIVGYTHRMTIKVGPTAVAAGAAADFVCPYGVTFGNVAYSVGKALTAQAGAATLAQTNCVAESLSSTTFKVKNNAAVSDNIVVTCVVEGH